MTFATQLKQARSQAGLTQVQVAEFAGVTDRHVRRWEAGTSQPNALTRRAVLAYLRSREPAKNPKSGAI